MCLFCTSMFVFSALLVFSNSLEHWGCCWIVRIMVGCWLEITVNGLITLTKDILRNTKDVAFTFLGEGRGEGEREWVCFWMDLHCKSPHSSAGNYCQPLHIVVRVTMASDLYFGPLSVCLAHPCLQGNYSSSWKAPHLCRGTSETGPAFIDTAVGLAASQHLCAVPGQSCCGLIPSFEPALALRLENSSLW